MHDIQAWEWAQLKLNWISKSAKEMGKIVSGFYLISVILHKAKYLKSGKIVKILMSVVIWQ